MPTIGRRTFWMLVFLAAPVNALSGQDDQHADATSALDAAARNRLWNESVALVERGDFAAATTKLKALASAGVPAPADRLSTWLDEWNALEQQRRDLTRRDFEKYVRRSKKAHKEGELLDALGWASRACYNAEDRDAFLQEEWLGALITAALEEGARLCQKLKWNDAYVLYSAITSIHERNSTYRKLRRDAGTHARLEVVYTKDRKWADWLRGIDADLIAEAFSRIDRYYVKEPDFREIAIAGLERLLLLAESKTLRELFETLDDELRREEFRERLTARINRLQAAEQVSAKTAVKYFERALAANRQTIQLPEALVIHEFADAALAELDDFTNIIWPTEYKEFAKRTRGDFIGVGISIVKDPETDQIRVVAPLEDTPAYRAGIQADDIITQVDGVPTKGMSLTTAVQTITGPIGTEVTLTIQRRDRERPFHLRRAKVKIRSVKGVRRNELDEQKWDHLLDAELGIGYLRVVSFQENTVEDVREAIEALKQKNLRGLILDLRFNPGGLLQSAVQMADLFIEEGKSIVRTEGLNDRPFEIGATVDDQFEDLPLIVLTNESSASASEIVSGAIKDHHRGLIVGERTFGKFSVQKLMQLANSDAHLKLTTASYYLPSGKSLMRSADATEWGVEPDVVVHLVPNEIQKVYELRRRADELQRRDVGDDVEGDGGQDAADAENAPPVVPDTDVSTDAGSANMPTGAEDEGDASADEAAAGTDDGQSAADDAVADAEDIDEEEGVSERPDVDPQLQTALLIMRIKLLHELDTTLARSEHTSPIRSE